MNTDDMRYFSLIFFIGIIPQFMSLEITSFDAFPPKQGAMLKFRANATGNDTFEFWLHYEDTCSKELGQNEQKTKREYPLTFNKTTGEGYFDIEYTLLPHRKNTSIWIIQRSKTGSLRSQNVSKVFFKSDLFGPVNGKLEGQTRSCKKENERSTEICSVFPKFRINQENIENHSTTRYYECKICRINAATKEFYNCSVCPFTDRQKKINNELRKRPKFDLKWPGEDYSLLTNTLYQVSFRYAYESYCRNYTLYPEYDTSEWTSVDFNSTCGVPRETEDSLNITNHSYEDNSRTFRVDWKYHNTRENPFPSRELTHFLIVCDTDLHKKIESSTPFNEKKTEYSATIAVDEGLWLASGSIVIKIFRCSCTGCSRYESPKTTCTIKNRNTDKENETVASRLVVLLFVLIPATAIGVAAALCLCNKNKIGEKYRSYRRNTNEDSKYILPRYNHQESLVSTTSSEIQLLPGQHLFMHPPILPANNQET